MIIIGTYFGGKTKKLQNQWIETKYFLLMVPLFPISSIFVTESTFGRRKGVPVQYTGESTFHGYLRFFTLVFTILIFIFQNYASHDFTYSLPIVFMVTAGLYVWSTFEKSMDKSKDVDERLKLGAIIGLNALPEWLEKPAFTEMLEKIKAEVNQEFGSTDAIALARTPNATPKQTAYLFAYLRYLVVTIPGDPALESALNTVRARYDRIVDLKTDLGFKEMRKNMDDDLSNDFSTEMG
jgi:hypothetical protein